MISRFTIICLVSTAFLLSGCNSSPSKPFHIKQLAKSDIDGVIDLQRNTLFNLTKELAVKLYKRNPRELTKGGQDATIEEKVALLMQLHDQPNSVTNSTKISEVGFTSIRHTFDEQYQGDRVFSLILGMLRMLNATYEGKKEFFFTDQLDQQKIYHCARNIETIAWMLSNKVDSKGLPFLLSNGTDSEGTDNLSYERLFGKMIGLQDLLANIIADSTNRTIKNVVHKAASMTLLPI